MDELLLPKDKIVLVAFGGEETKKVSVEEFQRDFDNAKTKGAKVAVCLRVLGTFGYNSKLDFFPKHYDNTKEFRGL